MGFGVALVENGHRPALATSRRSRRTGSRRGRRSCSPDARARWPACPWTTIDVLILDQIGKDISGTGLDPNVIGRGKAGAEDAGPPSGGSWCGRLTHATEGNASGIGFADVALRRAVDAIDPRKTYLNGITAKDVEGAKIPITVDTDEDALALALAACLRVDAATAADRPRAQHQAPRAPVGQRARPRRRARDGALRAGGAAPRDRLRRGRDVRPDMPDSVHGRLDRPAPDSWGAGSSRPRT